MTFQNFSQEIGEALKDALINQLVIGDVEGKKSSIRGIIGVTKTSASLPVSGEQLADAQEFNAAMRQYLRATDEERAAMTADALTRRAAERRAAERCPLTFDALLGKLNFTREYAEHLVQPYCDCWAGMDGWEYCQHARDEGLVP